MWKSLGTKSEPMDLFHQDCIIYDASLGDCNLSAQYNDIGYVADQSTARGPCLFG